jgi:hypothetical protein
MCTSDARGTGVLVIWGGWRFGELAHIDIERYRIYMHIGASLFIFACHPLKKAESEGQ